MCCFVTVAGEVVPGERRIWKAAEDPEAITPVLPGNPTFTTQELFMTLL